MNLSRALLPVGIFTCRTRGFAGGYYVLSPIARSYDDYADQALDGVGDIADRV